MNEMIGQGTILAVSPDGGTNWTNVARLETIGEFSLGEVEDVETTTHDSAGGFKTYIAGLAEAGELSFSGVWIADTSQRNLAAIRGAARDWRITLPGGLGVFRCAGYLKALTVNPQREGRIEFSCSVKLSGAPTMTW